MFTRRTFLRNMLSMAAVTGGALGASSLLPGAHGAEEPGAGSRIETPNVLMIVNDEERHWDMIENLIPSDLLGAPHNPEAGTFRSQIPARMKLRSKGVRFSNYYTPTAPCCPARGVMYTGHHAPDTQVVDNIEFGQESLDSGIPTIADVMGRAGYYCAYKGKVHLAEDSRMQTAADMLRLYGFHDWQGPYRWTDHEGPQSGTNRDIDIARFAAKWLAGEGVTKNGEGTPWLLAVNFINPHDIMMVDVDGDGTTQLSQGEGLHKFPLGHVPDKPPYYFWWNPQKPANFCGQNGYTRETCGPIPKMMDEFASLLSVYFGNIPLDDTGPGTTTVTVYVDNAQPDLGTKEITVPMWQAYVNYYINCIIDNDAAIMRVLRALTRNNLQDSTIVVFTADHGEFAMSHMGHSRYYDEAATPGYEPPSHPAGGQVVPLRQKGPFVYEENNNLPFIVANLSTDASSLVSKVIPARNIDTPALASSVDILPTFLAWAGKDNVWYEGEFGEDLTALAMRTALPGVPLNAVVKSPRSFKAAKWSDGSNGREWVLFTTDNISTLDANYGYIAAWDRPEIKANPKKRGMLRGVFDGVNKYARYFSPLDYNLNSEEFAALGYTALKKASPNGQDLQLFDHSEDSYETFNKAGAVPDSTLAAINMMLYQAMSRELYSTTRTPTTVQTFLDTKCREV